MYDDKYTGNIVASVYSSNLNLASLNGEILDQLDIGDDITIFANWAGTYYIKIEPFAGIENFKGSFGLGFVAE